MPVQSKSEEVSLKRQELLYAKLSWSELRDAIQKENLNNPEKICGSDIVDVAKSSLWQIAMHRYAGAIAGRILKGTPNTVESITLVQSDLKRNYDKRVNEIASRGENLRRDDIFEELRAYIAKCVPFKCTDIWKKIRNGQVDQKPRTKEELEAVLAEFRIKYGRDATVAEERKERYASVTLDSLNHNPHAESGEIDFPNALESAVSERDAEINRSAEATYLMTEEQKLRLKVLRDAWSDFKTRNAEYSEAEFRAVVRFLMPKALEQSNYGMKPRIAADENVTTDRMDSLMRALKLYWKTINE